MARRYRKQLAMSDDVPTLRRVVNATQTAVDEVTQPLVEHPLLPEGDILESVAITTSATQVAHKLQRKPRGWIVVRRNANAVVYEDTQTDPTRFLTLKASASVTVDLYVFA